MEANSLPGVDSLAAGRLTAFLNVGEKKSIDGLQATPVG
jgi:hypothetical protein